MKKSMHFFILMLIGVSFLFMTCEVGLGSSVDTQPPIVSINYPPAASVIRGSFTVAGNTDDETGVKNITVTLRNREGNTVAGQWQAAINSSDSSWTAEIPNAKTAAGTSPIPDGDYELTAEAVDTADRKSSVKTTYVIDNTPPILVITQPSTKGLGQAHEFGSELNLTGMQYDVNSVDKISFMFYDKNGTKICETNSINPLPNWSIDIPSSSDVFGHLKDAMENTPETYWYSASVSDNAYEYKTPAETAQSAGGKTGNTNSYYYTWSDITGLLQLGEFVPKISALYKLDNGIPIQAGEMPPSISAVKIEPLRISSADADVQSDKNGTFSIDPDDISPRAEVTGLTAGAGALANQIAQKSILRVELHRGKNDTAPILPNDIFITLYRLGLDGKRGAVAQERKNLTGTSGNPIIINYPIDADVGMYQLDIEAKDINGNKAKNSIYNFTVNAGAPSIELSPGATSTAKIHPDGSGKFTVAVTAKDDGDYLSLKVTEETDDGTERVPADMTVSGPVKGTEGSRNTFKWTLALEAAPEEGGQRRLLFMVSDEKFDTRIGRTFQTDTVLPALKALDKPSVRTSGAAAGTAVVSDLGIAVLGYADEDMTKTQVCFTTSNTAPAKNYSGWKDAVAENGTTVKDGQTVRAFSADLKLNPDAGKPEEGTYYLWARFADETWDDVTGQMGPAVSLCTVLLDKTDPVLAETKLSAPLEYGGREFRNGTFTLGGTASDANGIDSLSLVPKKDNTAQKPAALTLQADKTWSYTETSPADGVYSYTITATDKADKSVSLVREVMADSAVPVLAVKQPAENGFINTASYTFEGTSKDTGSGIASVEISFDNVNWITPSGTESWVYVKDFTGGTEGLQTVYIRSRDRAGNQVSMQRHYSIDKNPPEITETSVPDQNLKYTKEKLWEFKGTAKDTNGVKSVSGTMTKDSSPAAAAVTVKVDANGNWTAPISAMSSGTYTFEFTVTDKADRTAAVTRKLSVDTDKPVIEITSITPVASASDGNEYVNGSITVKGNFSDNDKITSGSYTVGSTPAAELTPLSTWNFSIDTTAFTDNAPLTISIQAADRAGNTQTITKQIKVRQSTDKPILTLTNADVTVKEESGINRNINLFSTAGNNKILGTISDDDGFGSLAVSVDGTLLTESTAIKLSDITVPAAGSTTGAFSMPVDKLAEDIHQVSITVTDKIGTNGANSKTAEEFFIGIDNADPLLTIDTPQGGYLGGTVTITGTAKDTSGILSLQRSDGTPVNLTIKEGSLNTKNSLIKWEYGFNADTFAEGGNSIIFSAADSFGKTSDVPFTFLVDKIKPQITDISWDAYVFKDVSPYYKIRATAVDTAPGSAEDTYYAIVAGTPGISGAPADADAAWKPLSRGTGNTWNADIPFETVVEGNWTIYVTVKDTAGNWLDRTGTGDHTLKFRTIYADNAEPSVTLSGIPLAGGITGSDFTLTGSISDTNLQGTITAVIKSGGTVTGTIAGTVTGSGDLRNWNIVVPVSQSAYTSGAYTAEISAQDIHSRTGKLTYAFTVDKTPPVIETPVITPLIMYGTPAAETVNGTITVTGRASDDDRISDIYWTVSAGDSGWKKFGTPAETDSATGTVSIIDPTGKFTLSKINTTLGANIKDGKLSLRIRAIDRAGNKTIYTAAPVVNQDSDKPEMQPVNLDNDAPDAVPGVSGTNSVNIFGKTGNNQLRFTVGDDDGVSKVWVKHGATTAAAQSAVYPEVPSSVFDTAPVSGSFTYSLASLAEGPYSFYIKVADKYYSGDADAPFNYREYGPYNIAVDEGAPVITIMSPADNDWGKDSFIIRGNAGDGNGVTVTTAGSSLTAEDGTPYIPVFAPGETKEWVHKYTVPENAVSPYSVTFTATDTFGRTSTAVLRYRLDKDKPSVTIAPSMGGPFYINMETPILKLSGTAADDPGSSSTSDKSGLNDIRYAVVPDTAGAPAAPPAFDSDKWYAAAGITSWTANIDLTIGSITGITSGEGTYKVYITARDIAGNWSDITAAQTRVLYTDMNAPQIGKTITVNPASASAKTNLFRQNFAVSGAVSDTVGLQSITAILKNGKSLVLSSPAFTPGISAEYAWTFDVPVTAANFPDGSGGIKDGEYDITIAATDMSGKRTSINWTFSIDSNSPKLEFSNLTPISGSGMVSFTESAPRILGTFSDTGSGIKTIRYLFQRKTAGGYTPSTPGAADIVSAYTGIAEGSSSGGFTLPVPGLAENTDGIYRLVMIAEDTAGNVSPIITSPEFLIDQHLPELNITLPQLKKIVQKGDKLEVSGTAEDMGGGTLASIEIIINHTSFSAAEKTEFTKKIAAADMTGKNWAWTLAAGASSPYRYDNDYTITVTAVDAAGNRREQTRSVSCDNTPPSLTFKRPFLMAPGSGATSQTSPVIGEVIVEGSADDFSMQSVYYQIGGTVSTAKDSSGAITGIDIAGAGITSGVSTPAADTGITGQWVKSNDNYGWSFTANTLEYQNLAYQTPGTTAENLKTLPVYVAAVDEAGNLQLARYPINIDTDIDKPTIEILSPDIDTVMGKAKVGGSFIVSGGAADNNYVHSVYMQLEVVNGNYVNGVLTARESGTKFPGVSVAGGRTAQQIKNGTGSDTPYFTKIDTEAEPSLDAWYKAEGQSAWKFVLNKNGEFFNKNLKPYYTQSYIDDTSSGGYQDSKLAEVIVRVMVLDTKNPSGILSDDCKFGEQREIRILIDQDAPGIAVIKLPEQNSFAGGKIPVEIVLNDDGEVKFWSLTANDSIPIDTSGFTVTKNTIKDWDVKGLLDSAALAQLCKTNIITFKIEVTDNEGKTSAITRRFTVDNSPPKDINGGKLKNEDNSRESADRGSHLRIMTTEAILQSKVADEVNGSDIKEIILYFTRTSGGQTRAYSMGGTAQDTAGTLLTHTVTLPFIQPNGSIGTKQVPFPESSLDAVKTKDSPPTAYVVVDTAEGGDDNGYNGDGDGYDENLRLTGDWFVKLDSTKIRDGIYTIHYIVVDKAGNAMYYEDSMLVQNSGPKIQNILLATDINGDGAVNTDETAGSAFEGKVFTPKDFAATGFSVRNNKLTIKVTATGDNKPLKYYLKYPTSSGGILQMQNGTGIFEISNFPAELTDPEAASYTVWVEDSVEPALTLSSGESNVSLILNNIDKIAPEAKLYELNTKGEYTPTAVIPGIGHNETMGSLYFTGAGGDVYSGHIELRQDSPFDNAAIRDPDISGSVILRGYAEDNQRIGSISLVLGNETVTIASGAVSGRLEAAIPGVTIYDELTLEGHKAEWSYVWNTAAKGTANMTGTNVRVQIIAEDASKTSAGILNPNKNAARSYTGAPGDYNVMTADIVPYIRTVETAKRIEGGLKNNNIRSADGKYSIIQGNSADFITVRGYNLNPIANGVRIVSSAQAADRSGLIGGGTVFAGTSLTFSSVSSDGTALQLSNNSPKSGYLAIVGGTQAKPIPALNNINNNEARDGGNIQQTGPYAYNREPDKYVTMNATLTDDRYLRFFKVSDTGIKNGYYPTMIMDGNDPVFGYVDLTGGTSAEAGSYYPSHAMPQRSKFNGITGAKQSAEYLVKASIWDQMAMAKDDSGRYIMASVYNRDGAAMSLFYDKYASLYSEQKGWGAGTGYSGYNGNSANDRNNNAINLETTDYGSLMLDRYKYPKLIAKGNSVNNYAAVYMLYYDDNTAGKELLFRTFQIGTRDNKRTIPLYSGSGFAQYTNMNENTANSNSWNIGRLPAASNASQYFDIGVTSNGTVVIIYYDETMSRLKLQYSSAPVDGSNPLADITWIESQAGFPDYTGSYVSMAIDSNDRIHIAAFDANEADLVYMFLPSCSSPGMRPVTVDSTGSVGLWTQVKVRNSVPYIAYYNNSENGTRDSIKLAYAHTPVAGISDVKPGTDSGLTTGNWEYMTVPAATPPQGGIPKFKQVNLDFDASGKPIIGYLGTNIEFTGWITE